MAFAGDSIYWVEVEKVVPNPFQPRREFDESKLQELSESIRMYGVLQPLTVTRQEVRNEDGTFFTQYELIAGERRLRASRLAGVAQVPVIIREGEDSEQEKLELAIIENLQREDLNAIDRALAFQQLAEQFGMNHAQVGKKVGRSREYVANSIRLLQLPEHMMDSVRRGELGEGHARTLLMLSDRPEEQETLYRETLLKKMSVRELERITRKIATDKVRKHKEDIDEHLIEIEKEFTETLGTRVQIQRTEFGGKLTIDYFADEDLMVLLQKMKDEREGGLQLGQNAGAVAGAAVAASAAAAPAMRAPEQTVTPTQPEPAPVSPVAPAAPVSQPTPIHTPGPTPEPFMHANSTPPVAPQVTESVTQPAPAPTADQSLLERLAAHTPLSFVTKSHTEPAAEPEPTPVPQEPVAPAAPVSQPTPVPSPDPQPLPTNLVSDTPAADMPQSPSQPDQSDDDQDIYSLKNFTV